MRLDEAHLLSFFYSDNHFCMDVLFLSFLYKNKRVENVRNESVFLMILGIFLIDGGLCSFSVYFAILLKICSSYHVYYGLLQDSCQILL